MPAMLPTLKGQKINLRRVHKSDAESIYRYARDNEISRYTFLPNPYRIDDAYRFISTTHAALRAKKAFIFGIEHKQEKKIIGMISLEQVNFQHLLAEAGYWLGKQFWGQGIAKEALQLLLNFGFKQLKLNRIYARVMHPNTASCRLLERTGFRKEGVMRKAVWRDGLWLDLIWYAILKDEFKEFMKRNR
ncbi:MAG: GNAT family N-acetyltransferase [candidate division Zixibacteria bacterium]|nr:GNAT family N-acetyltransferase [candidate division Zixibacteria bacterium]